MHLDNYLNFFQLFFWIWALYELTSNIRYGKGFIQVLLLGLTKFIIDSYITYTFIFIFTLYIHFPSFQLSVLLHGVMVMEAQETKANSTWLALCSDECRLMLRTLGVCARVTGSPPLCIPLGSVNNAHI